MALSKPTYDERTRKRMVELSIPAGADTVQLVERIAGEMAENARLREALRAATTTVEKREARHGRKQHLEPNRFPCAPTEHGKAVLAR